MKGASFFPFVGLMLAAWGVYEIFVLANELGRPNNAPGTTAFYSIAPGVTVAGTQNSTGGFTEAPSPYGIGGGFAT